LINIVSIIIATEIKILCNLWKVARSKIELVVIECNSLRVGSKNVDQKVNCDGGLLRMVL